MVKIDINPLISFRNLNDLLNDCTNVSTFNFENALKTIIFEIGRKVAWSLTSSRHQTANIEVKNPYFFKKFALCKV